MRAQIFKVINWAKLALFWSPKLGPVNNFNLAQLITLKNLYFGFFFAFKNVPKYLFYSVFLNINQNLQKNGQKKR